MNPGHCEHYVSMLTIITGCNVATNLKIKQLSVLSYCTDFWSYKLVLFVLYVGNIIKNRFVTK